MKWINKKLVIAPLLFFIIEGCSKDKPVDERTESADNDKIEVKTIEVDQVASRFARISWSATSKDFSSSVSIPETGVCYGTNNAPTVRDNHVSVNTENGGWFDTRLSGLTINTTYYVRAYAKYNNTIVYGDILSFKTLGVAQLESVTIGNQIWSKNNLDVTVFRNGESIPVAGGNNANDPANYPWSMLNKASASYWQSNTTYLNIYGMLYNFYAVRDARGLAPEGWHIPTNAEWQTLISYLGGESVAGGKLKETGFSHWLSPNTGATNSSGFSALPGSMRSPNAEPPFPYSIGYDGIWWSADTKQNDNYLALAYSLFNQSSSITKHTAFFQTGASIRLIKD
ncbi:fibrobacter succinogenes major paralogous domain-containing protein [Niabella aquatica]